MIVLGLVCSGALSRPSAASLRQLRQHGLRVNQGNDLLNGFVRKPDERVRKHARINPPRVLHGSAHGGETAVRVANDHHWLGTLLCAQHRDGVTSEILDVKESRATTVKLGMTETADIVGDDEMALLEMRDVLKETEAITFHAVNEDDARLRPVTECLVVESGT